MREIADLLELIELQQEQINNQSEQLNMAFQFAQETTNALTVMGGTILLQQHLASSQQKRITELEIEVSRMQIVAASHAIQLGALDRKYEERLKCLEERTACHAGTA